MRPDIDSGAPSTDCELADHTDDPASSKTRDPRLALAGHYCPKEHQRQRDCPAEVPMGPYHLPDASAENRPGWELSGRASRRDVPWLQLVRVRRLGERARQMTSPSAPAR